MTLSILIVDRASVARDALQQTLTNAGMQVVTAEDGMDALNICESACPNAIVTEILLPRLDGFRLIDAVRKRANRPHIPVLVLTEGRVPDQMSRARQVGATGWIMKPFDPVKIVTALQAVID